MHFSTATIISLATFVADVCAHGVVNKPATRKPGAATQAACGKGLVDFYNKDNTTYPEALLRANGLDSGYNAQKCNIWLCKGFQFDDNTANVMKYKPGDVINMEVWIRIPHKGYANVSVVDMAANKPIGGPLLKWADGYADGAVFPNLPKDQTTFSVKVPELGGQCTKPGACVR
jgi:hypothetical protein